MLYFKIDTKRHSLFRDRCKVIKEFEMINPDNGLEYKVKLPVAIINAGSDIVFFECELTADEIIEVYRVAKAMGVK